MTVTDFLLEPFIIGTAVFMFGTAVMVIFIAATTTRRWHNKHHQNRSELMCDHCRERRNTDPLNAPPLRVLGEPRR